MERRTDVADLSSWTIAQLEEVIDYLEQEEKYDAAAIYKAELEKRKKQNEKAEE